MHKAIQQTFLSISELFTNPLNCSMVEGITYCTSFSENYVFGAIHNSYGYRWTGSCIGNPEYEQDDMRQAVLTLHALASSLETDTAFLAILILPVWEGTPWAAASIKGHQNIRTLIRIPAGHMRFVPWHQQSDSDPTTLHRPSQMHGQNSSS